MDGVLQDILNQNDAEEHFAASFLEEEEPTEIKFKVQHAIKTRPRNKAAGKNSIRPKPFQLEVK